jgi:hypothetical protein
MSRIGKYVQELQEQQDVTGRACDAETGVEETGPDSEPNSAPNQPDIESETI